MKRATRMAATNSRANLALRKIGVALAAIVPAASHAAAGDALATTSRAYSVIGQPAHSLHRLTGQVVADFDGDGDLDVAVSASGSFGATHHGFRVMMNTGQGELSAPVRYDTPSGPTVDICAADLDGDGDVDLALAQNETVLGQWALVFLNNGDGTFGAERRWAVPPAPVRIIAADVENDGDVDLITASFFSNRTVSVLYNDGAGGFPRRADFPIGENPLHVAAGDLTGEGFVDIVVSYESGGMSIGVLENDAAGGFGAPVLYRAVGLSQAARADIAIGDVDGDGDRDVVYGRAQFIGYQSPMTLFRNDGLGRLDAKEPFATAFDFFARRVLLTDATGDGRLDVAASGETGGYGGWALMAGDGGGGFGPGSFHFTGETPEDLAIADLTGDGAADAIVTNVDVTTLTVHAADPETGFGMPGLTAVEQFTDRLAVGDIDLDGDLDVVTAYSSWVYSLFNRGDGSFDPVREPYLLGCMEAIRLADVNGDGFPDVLMTRDRNCSPYNFYTAINDGDGTFGPLTAWQISSAGRNEFVALDWDLDGDLDVVISEGLGCPTCTPNQLYFLEGRGDGTFAPVRSQTHPIFPGLWLDTGDFNEDGIPDLVGAGDGAVVHIGRGDGTFESPIAYGADVFPHWLKADDMNNDGHLDIAYSASHYFGAAVGSLNVVGVMLGAGDGSFVDQGYQLGAYANGLTAEYGLDTLDANRDGNRDIVVSSIYGGDLLLFQGHGDGTLAAQQRYGVDGRAWLPVAADFDGDGIDDVAIAVENYPPVANGNVTILRGLGSVLTVGDTNCDGAIDAFDIEPFILALTDPNGYAVRFPDCDIRSADANGDGTVDSFDIEPFIGLLTGP